MTHTDLMNTWQWQHVRWHVWDRDHGKCRICGSPGMDTHHLSYRLGFFNPRAIILVCRPCHLIWQGEDPAHLGSDHPLRSKLFQIAAISRSLGRTTETLNPKVSAPLPDWLQPLFDSTRQVLIVEVRKMLAAGVAPNH